MNIDVLNDNFELVCEIDSFDSLRWVRRWHKPGEAQLVISAAAKHAEKLRRGNVLIYKGKAAIISSISVALDERTGAETLTIKAKGCGAICGRRIIMPPAGYEYDIQVGAAETVMKNYVNNTFGLTSFVIAADQGRGGEISYSARFDNLQEVLELISANTGMGWDVYVDKANSRFVFEVYEGADRRFGSNNPVVFCPDYDNIRTQSYSENDESYRNVAIVAGQGEGVNRVIMIVGDGSGLERREVFIDARDIADAEYLPARGPQILTEYPLVQTFECDVLDRPECRYGTHWDLGDVVTVENKKWGVYMDVRVVEVAEEVSRQGTTISATFGTGKILLSDAVKRVTSQAERALKVSAGSYVIAPETSSNGNLATFDGTDGKKIKDSGNILKTTVKVDNEDDAFRGFTAYRTVSGGHKYRATLACGDVKSDGTRSLALELWDETINKLVARFDLTNIDLRPYTDDTYDLGSSTKRWKDVYLSGVLKGTNFDDYSKGTNGYQRLWSGILIQWGRVNITPVANTPTYAEITFPKNFTTVLAITTTPTTSYVGTEVLGTSVQNTSISGCRIYIYRTNTTTTEVRWIAVGY